jgi:hypothetical protein
MNVDHLLITHFELRGIQVVSARFDSDQDLKASHAQTYTVRSTVRQHTLSFVQEAQLSMETAATVAEGCLFQSLAFDHESSST